MLQDILIGLKGSLSMGALISINIGVLAGIIMGALPGLGVAMAVTVILPLVFGMETANGLLLLLGVYCGGTYGGSITAILIKTPGAAASITTAIDGYELTKKGHSKKALDMAITASTVGGIISAITLVLFAPVLAKFVLKFGPPEYFSLAVFGLTIIASVSGDSILKGLILGAFGVFISTIGLDLIHGIPRFTLGTQYLKGGIGIVPAIVGVFSIAEILVKAPKLKNMKPYGDMTISEDNGLTKKDMKKSWKTILRSSGIGTVIGAIPGAGAVIAAFIGYAQAKRASKNPEEFGKGSIEGVAAAEAANNAVTSSSLIPMLTLGVPGSVVSAIVMGALIMNGLVPGANLFTEQKPLTYTVMVGMIIINIFMFIQAKGFIKLFVKVTKIQPSLLMVLVMAMALTGTYAVNNTLLDIFIVIIFAIIGVILIKLDFALPPLILGLVLGPIAENTMRQSLLMSGGEMSIFVTRPICIIFLSVALLSVVTTAIKRWREQK
ncbi:MAG: tripartite tricarboxylate transporter permease [Spirochaetaceae bacterium]